MAGGPVWIDRVNSQVSWEGRAGKVEEWLVVELVVERTKTP